MSLSKVLVTVLVLVGCHLFSNELAAQPNPNDSWYLYYPDGAGKYFRFEYKKIAGGTSIEIGKLHFLKPMPIYNSFNPNVNVRALLLSEKYAVDPDQNAQPEP